MKDNGAGQKCTFKHYLPCNRTASLWVLWEEAEAALVPYHRDAAVYLELNPTTDVTNHKHAFFFSFLTYKWIAIPTIHSKSTYFHFITKTWHIDYWLHQIHSYYCYGHYCWDWFTLATFPHSENEYVSQSTWFKRVPPQIKWMNLDWEAGAVCSVATSQLQIWSWTHVHLGFFSGSPVSSHLPKACWEVYWLC